MGRILQGDFGPSLKIRDFSVGELIASGAPASMELGIAAIALALVIGVSFGTLAALRQNSGTDFSVMSISMIGIAVRSEEHTSELQSLMRISYAVFCLKKKKKNN